MFTHLYIEKRVKTWTFILVYINVVFLALYMSILTNCLLFLDGIVVFRFWCRGCGILNYASLCVNFSLLCLLDINILWACSVGNCSICFLFVVLFLVVSLSVLVISKDKVITIGDEGDQTSIVGKIHEFSPETECSLLMLRD